MISFGELRKKSVAWQMELGAVEKIYALDWLLKAIVERPALERALILRDASALSKAYFENYPQADALDFARGAALDNATLETELNASVENAARTSGLQFKLHSVQSSEARVEFAGPLGRRSAAQPLLIARFVLAAPRVGSVVRAMIHPFSDTCAANVRAMALTELAAERMVLYAQKPRARDVFDLWFIVAHGADALDENETRNLARRIADEKRVVLRTTLSPDYAPLLERAWQNALKEIRPHPAFAAARSDIENRLARFI